MSTNTITNAAGITVLNLADSTTNRSGGVPPSVGGTVIRAVKGPVGVVNRTTYQNYQEIFGRPFPKNAGPHMEGMRHLAEALRECDYANVVRVVAADARFPSLAVKFAHDRGAWAEDTPYAVNDVVTVVGGKLICLAAHTSGSTAPTFATPGANWAVYTTPLAVNQGAWETATDYAVNDTVTVAGGTLICLVAHTSSGETEPEYGNPGNNWKAYTAPLATVARGDWAATTAYGVNDVVTVIGGTLICIVGHTSGSTAPTVSNPGVNWAVYYESLPVVAAAHAYGTTLTLGSGFLLQVYPIDGDPSPNRSFQISDISTAKKRFRITFYDKDDTGAEYLLESFTVSADINDKDDLGRSAYIATVLEEQSSRFRCQFNGEFGFEGVQLLSKTAFTGGTNGGTPTTQDYLNTWDIFRSDSVKPGLLFAAGCYDIDVLANCIAIADLRHCSFFFDVPPGLTATAALAWLAGAEPILSSRQAAVYYCPYSATDPYYGGKTTWGASGAAVAACAKGDQNISGSTPGVHYPPAGAKRGTLPRTGVVPLYPSGVLDANAFYEARLNPINVDPDSGSLVIGDALALLDKENYTRFIWVNRIANYIEGKFVEMASALKFEPEGLTQGMENILSPLVVSEALAKPRDADRADDLPYSYTITQQEIDLWLVTWDFCPAGAARRIAGQPRLIR
jgi:hypothetical protein